MGGALSSTRRPLMIRCASPERRILVLRCGHPTDLFFKEDWKANDLLYQYIESERKMQMTNDPGSIMKTIAEYSPCENSRCKCKAGKFTEDALNTVGWANSKCTRSGCNHPLSKHIRHIVYVSNTEYMAIIKLVFDINNIKASLKILSAKPALQKKKLIESVYESVYEVLCKTVRYDPFKAPNIDTIFDNPPPFETISIRQILMNFSINYFCNNEEVLTFKQALMVTKFLFHSFDTWRWTAPNKISNSFSRVCSNPYSYYYCRYMVYCEMPRLAHSISPRYKASEIFGREVLSYTLESFYKELQVWCYKSNIMWNRNTKLHCLKYMPIYMTFLKTEYENHYSPIWTQDRCLVDVIRVSELSE
ncbi:unnamed protein product [Aphis gossypii]|uniref:PCAF N-terminal domain-containing protein n=2 Tax=Aphis gossypii TaxID=80765 RepID=A0A9P0NUC5_APHGO|nr:unnamed protein product [Aphis gossypii]